jgi:hypothetical protein
LISSVDPVRGNPQNTANCWFLLFATMQSFQTH